MKTIEILSKGRQVQFTTKSVTIDGTEYPYSHITELRHSEAKAVYGFKCDGEVVMLPYEAKDAKILKAIFSQVQQMHRKPAPKPPAAKAGQVQAETPVQAEAPVEAAETPAETAEVAEAPAEVPAEVAEAAETPAEVTETAEAEVAEAPAEVTEEAPAETAEAEAAEAPAVEEAPAPEEVPVEAPAETAEAEVAEVEAEAETAETTEAPAETAEETPAEETETPASEETETKEEEPAQTPVLSAKELRKEAKRKEKEQRLADKEAAKREKQAAKAAAKTGGDTVAYTEAAGTQMDPVQKTSRFKKGIIIFIIILAVFALLAFAYYRLIGPASDPQIGPNTTDQTQYNDIDDMINDLEN